MARIGASGGATPEGALATTIAPQAILLCYNISPMHPARSHRPHAVPLALLLLALALAPCLLLAHEAVEHAEHGSCQLSELAIDVNAAASLEQGVKPGSLPHPHQQAQRPSHQALPRPRDWAFAARAPPRVTGQIASVQRA